MANTCFTQFMFKGDTKEITDFYDKLNKWMSALAEGSYDVRGYRNILRNAGLADRINLDDSSGVMCRASVTSVEGLETLSSGESCFSVYVESDWTPMAKMWAALIEKPEYQSIKFAYLAEEPGFDIYQLYNPHSLPLYADPYYIELDISQEPDDIRSRMTDWETEGSIYFESRDNIVAFLQDLLGLQEDSYNKLLEELDQREFNSPDSFVDVHELDIVQELYD